MADRRLKRLYGGAVTGDYYWPRPDITDPMLESLLAGESLKQFGLRRTGKSSLMLAIQQALKNAGRKPVYIDVQGFDRIDNLVATLVSALPNDGAVSKITTALSGSRVSRGIGVVKRLVGSESQDVPSPRAMLHQIELLKGDLCGALAEQKRSVILLIDELPYLIDNMLQSGLNLSEVNGLLATMRKWRQEGQLPMLLTGSMGLSWLVREKGIAREHFNDVIPIDPPPPLSYEDARAMLQALALEENCSWMDEAFIAVILEENSANYPSFLQFAFGRLKGHRARSADDVRQVFAEHIRPGLDEDFYEQFETRLRRYQGDDKAIARAILRSVNSATGGSTFLASIEQAVSKDKASDVDEMLAVLVDDGFLRMDRRSRTVSFSSPLVQTWCQSKPWFR